MNALKSELPIAISRPAAPNKLASSALSGCALMQADRRDFAVGSKSAAGNTVCGVTYGLLTLELTITAASGMWGTWSQATQRW